MVDEKQWIWQDKAYPHFEYNLKKLNKLTESISREQGKLIVLRKVIGQENLDFGINIENHLSTRDRQKY